MLRLEPSSGLGGRGPGLLPVLLALLCVAWAEVRPLQLRGEQAPMPGGKGPWVRQGGGAMMWRRGPRGLLEASSRPEPWAG